MFWSFGFSIDYMVCEVVRLLFVWNMWFLGERWSGEVVTVVVLVGLFEATVVFVAIEFDELIEWRFVMRR